MPTELTGHAGGSRPGSGRPKLSSKVKKVVVGLRLDPATQSLLKKNAGKLGLKESEFARKIITDYFQSLVLRSLVQPA